MSTPLKTFVKDDSGAIGVMSLFMILAVIIVSALALDVAYLQKSRNQLQVTADAAAHAALYTRELNSPDIARAKGLEVAAEAMDPDYYGDIVKVEDMTFGVWDHATGTFTADNNRKDAVRVITQRTHERENSAASMFFRFVGFRSFEIRTQSIFTTYIPPCFKEGIVAESFVDLQSNNGYENGFCVHSNDHVEINQNNTFEAGTVVSMPNEGDLVLPQSGFESNSGLQAALRSGVYRLRILNRLDSIFTGLLTGDPRYIPDYITNTVPIELTGNNKVDASILLPGRVYTKSCNGGADVTIGNNAGPISKVVFITTCGIKFENATTLEDAVVGTYNTNVKSVTAPAGLQLGKDDHCAPGGGAQLLTYGGVDVPADLRMYGGQILAMKDIEFAANANGIEGASMVSYGSVSGTSNMTMGFCGTGMENNFEAEYFRLAL